MIKTRLSATLHALKAIWTTTTAAVGRYFGYLTTWTQPSPANLARKAMRNPYAFRAIQLIRETLASVELLVYHTKGEDLQEDEKHPITLLLERPNPRENGLYFIHKLVTNFFVAGENFLLPIGPTSGTNAGRPRELYLLDPDAFEDFIRDENDFITGYRFRRKKGPSVEYTTDEVLHIRTYNALNPDRGFPILIAALQALDIMDEGAEWNKSISEQKGQIAGVFSFAGDKPLKDEAQIQALDERLNKKLAEKRRKNEAIFLNADMKYQPNVMTPVEAAWLESDQAHMRKIAAALGVSPRLLGDDKAGSLTDAGIKSEMAALYMLTVLPLLDFILAELNAWLMPRFGQADRWLGYSKDHIEALQEGMTEKYQRAAIAVTNGLNSVNEQRTELGWEARPEPECDALFVPMGRMPLVEPEPVDDPEEDEEPAELSRLGEGEYKRYLNVDLPALIDRVAGPGGDGAS